jgi:hypothetical protein
VRVEVAAAAGIDLHRRDTGGGNALGIVARLLIPFEDGKMQLVLQIAERPLKEGRLAGTGGADKIIDKESLVPKDATILGGKPVILGEKIFFDSDDTPLALICGGMVMVVMMMTARATTAICTHN